MNCIKTVVDRAYFNRGIAHLLLYRTKNNCLNVPYDYIHSDGFRLGQFIKDVRVLYKNNELKDDQIEKLTDIGFAFNEQDQEWEFIYKILEAYIKKYGKFPSVKYKNIDDVMIGAWYYRQNQIFYQLPSEKKEKLLLLKNMVAED